jgi:hypothetical protein
MPITSATSPGSWLIAVAVSCYSAEVDSHRIQLAIPDSADLEGGGEAFARRVAAMLMDGMERRVGAVELGDGRVVWQAESWQEDGSFVVLGVDPAERSLQLLLTTRGLLPPGPEPRWVWPLIAVLLGASVALGLWRHSFWLAVFAAVVAFAIWIAVDITRQGVVERRRHIDPAAWQERLEAALDSALGDSRA